MSWNHSRVDPNWYPNFELYSPMFSSLNMSQLFTYRFDVWDQNLPCKKSPKIMLQKTPLDLYPKSSEFETG